MNLIEALNWRYATKRMNGNKLSAEQLQYILESIRLSPSSRGFQPYKIFVVHDADLKQRIKPIADDQPQIIESSHLLIFASHSNTTREEIESYIAYIAREREVPVERLDKMKSMLLNEQLRMSQQEYIQWASRQIYLALGVAIVAASQSGIDATPMEGFNPTELDKLLGLQEQGLRSTVLLALGYRDVENDWLVKLKKVRRRREELFCILTSADVY